LLDIEKPPAAQGIEPGSYDVVIAANVLHATGDIRRTLRHAKAALRRNGVLLLNEMSRNSMFSHLTFGLLEGWWLYQDDHLRIPGCPALAPDRWRDVLGDEGFRTASFPAEAAHILGHQIVLAESDGVIRQERTLPNASEPSRVSPPAIACRVPIAPAQALSDAKASTINVRTAIRESVAQVLKMDAAAIAEDQSFSNYGVDSILSVALMKEVNKRLRTSLATITLFDHNSVGRLADHIVAEHQASLAAPIPIETLAPSPMLRTVVAPALAPQASNGRQANALITRVAKVLRESVAHVLKMDAATIAEDHSFSDYGVDSIVSVALVKEVNKQLRTSLATITLFDHNSVGRLADYIVAEHHAELAGLMSAERSARIEVSVPPQRPVPAADRAWQSYSGTNESRNGRRFEMSAKMPVEGRPACWQVVLDRPMDVADIGLVKVPLPELGVDGVRIAVRAFSLNFGDLLCVRGLYPTMPPYPFTPGSEISGIVAEVGPNVSSVRAGDSVIALMGETFGGQAAFVTCREEQLMRKPAALSFEQACAFPVVTMTMVDAFRKARLRKGETILIQTAAGGTGLVAVQMAQHCGAEIFATAGSPEKLDYLAGLGVRQLINYRQIDFETEIKRLTGGRGVDVVINTLSGDALQKGMRCLAAGGRYIEIAMTALRTAKSVDLSVLNDNQSFYSVDLRKLFRGNPACFADYRDETLSLVERGIVTPMVGKLFPMEQIRDAYAWLDNRNNIGKVVVSISDNRQFAEVPTGVPERAPRASTPSPAAPMRSPIAIVGMSGRFAKSPDLETLWQHLASGDDMVHEITRWELPGQVDGNAVCRFGGYLDDIDCFDPAFFNISEDEAIHMDPQQRLFLEEAWRSLEDAGHAGAGVRGKSCGVYVGCASGDYAQLFTDVPPALAFWGNVGSVIPARIAYHLDLHGPAVAVDTACSSGLVALHLACQGLWSGEIEMALAGGVFVQSSPQFLVAATRAKMLSPTGRCRSFEENADGFAVAEGIGVVVLKRLSDALADGDHIHGVIAGVAVNQDGASNGITAPSAVSQERLERLVYDGFAISPAGIQMVEAHGSGTKFGDAIEFQALTRCFRAYTDKAGYCALGSIKTNIGHATMASGIAGLLKILLSLKHRAIPPSLHYRQRNSLIAIEGSPFYVNAAFRDWTVQPGVKRRAALSAFGFSGTNAHLVIEEAPSVERRHAERPGYLIALSGPTARQLRWQAEKLLAYCQPMKMVDCGNLSFTLLLGRKHFANRLACVVTDHWELMAFLNAWLQGGQAPRLRAGFGNGPAAQDKDNLDVTETFGGPAEEYLDHLMTAAAAYVEGGEMDFAALFSSGNYSRLSLPTFQFLKGRYWVASEQDGEGPVKRVASPATGPSGDPADGEHDHIAMEISTIA
jgi:NADPH:quinone reductase-like Zn-dependent oxidoreductase/3-oxoacyl-(acyl-carrier-protein) synthase/acyl carrier protein